MSESTFDRLKPIDSACVDMQWNFVVCALQISTITLNCNFPNSLSAHDSVDSFDPIIESSMIN